MEGMENIGIEGIEGIEGTDGIGFLLRLIDSGEGLSEFLMEYRPE
jgi:hypothetical protein